jgi:hypothetical protein
MVTKYLMKKVFIKWEKTLMVRRISFQRSL